MYKVLLADDEMNILEGIAALVDWKGCGTELKEKAFNGQMAYHKIVSDPPDIVITDIKMPGMDGVELIEKVHQVFPNIRFIILSGYDEFEFAKKAMRYHVNHYLLKPSNEQKIEEALRQVVQELDDRKSREHFVRNIRTKLESLLPKAREQVLKEFVTARKLGAQEWHFFKQLFDLETDCRFTRLLMLKIDEDHDYEHVFALKEILMEQASGLTSNPLTTAIADKVVFLTESVPYSDLYTLIQNTKEAFHTFYKRSFTAAISSQKEFSQVRILYNEALDCLTQSFYLGSGSIITPNEWQSRNTEDIQLDHTDCIFDIKSGNVQKVQDYIEHFFTCILSQKYDVNVVKSHCLELYVTIIRQAEKNQFDSYFLHVYQINDFNHLHEVKAFIKDVAMEITETVFEQTKKTQSHLIARVKDYVVQNLANTDLSLNKIANEVLYMNPDYLGKLFKKETGQKFSSFLTNQRVERAIELIQQMEEVKVFEIAEKVGFGNNPRYFGQVFRKYTGVTPTNYKMER
ncbi:response regulator transcription factor [Radiobacillus kanasensis]|uniref:response regulator transcription factor n=1 Tax=Radiobacillus kanasensis TaxID=2844358 RepID=UPI001E54E4DF|nr:response regulator transcription factor [Radiobacillus kanasensis]UFT98757.1 response regulator transcription factor [Radiobacillus kanasensis]